MPLSQPIISIKPKPIITSLHTFYRALHWLHVFASCFDWFTGSPVSCVIGLSDNSQLTTALTYKFHIRSATDIADHIDRCSLVKL